MTLGYEQKECLFCDHHSKLRELYPQSFKDQDLTPQIFSARRQTDHFHYHMVRCRECGLVFSREVLAPDRLAGLYQDSSVTFEAYQSNLRRDYWKVIGPHLSTVNAGSALEIGCSSGFFLEELLDHGFQRVAGYEPSAEAKQKASPRVRESILTEFFSEPVKAPGKPYDLICSFHTLDHVLDPAGFVRSCLKALRVGGLCCMVVHDVDAWQAKLLGEKSPIIDIQHIYLFNRATLKRLFLQAGFEVVAVEVLANSYPLSYWIRMFPIKQRWKDLAEKVLQRLRLSQAAPSLRMGNIAIIARAPGRSTASERS